MTMRRILFALAVALLGGVTDARPPFGGLPEGRELDPVTRDYYLPASPAQRSAPAEPERTRGPAEEPYPLALLDALWEALRTELTIPLGTVELKLGM